MKIKGLLFVWLVLTVSTIVVLSVGLSTLFSIDIQKGFDTLKAENINLEDNLVLIENISMNIKNPIDFMYFIFGFKGFVNLLTFHSPDVWLTALFWNFLTPILGILTLGVSMMLIFKFVVERFRREYRFKQMKTIGKWLMYASMIFISITLLIGLSLLTSLDKPLSESSKLHNLMNYDESLTQSKDSFSYITVIQYLLPNKMIDLLANNTSSIEYLQISPYNMKIIISGMTFLIILSPIGLISLLFGANAWFSTFIAQRSSGFSKFSSWIGNNRIDSKREYNEELRRNIWFIIGSILYLSTIIVPGTIHKYENDTQIIISVVTCLLIPFGFVPIVFGAIQVKRFKQFSYNKLMWIQILIFWFVGATFQIVTWVLFKEYLNMPSALSSFWPMFIIIGLTVTGFGFLKFHT